MHSGGGAATARVFISYARADARKAEALAEALRASGHEVWWDIQIEGGARFSAAIDAALKKAEAVVVLWSEASIGSAWVQDEAAVGRDTRRLVPATLDGSLPPLGFRQFQCIDLHSWNRRGAPKQLDRINSAIAAVVGTGTPEATPHAGRPRTFAIPYKFAVAAAAGALAVGGALWLRTSSVSAAPSVTVTASNAAPGPLSAALAHNLALDLGRYQDGPLNGLSITDSTRGSAARADYRVEVGVQPGAAANHADIALLDRTDNVVWTSGIDTPAARQVDMRQQVSAQVGAVLACTVQAGRMQPQPARDVFSLYLTGCARISNASSERSDDIGLNTFRKITEKDP